MEGDINYEKKLDCYRDGLLPDETVILDSINAELKKNVFSDSWKKDMDLLKIKEGFDFYGQEWQSLFSKDIKTFWDKEVREKFYKLKYDINKRFWGEPTVVEDWENPKENLTLDNILAGKYEWLDAMLSWKDAVQRKNGLNFIKSISTYSWLDTNIKKILMKKIDSFLIQDIAANAELAKDIQSTMEFLLNTSTIDQEILNLNYTSFVTIFQWLPKDVSKNLPVSWWISQILIKSDLLQAPNNINDLLKICSSWLNIDVVPAIYNTLSDFNVDGISKEISIGFMENVILWSFPDEISKICYTKDIFRYMLKNNQFAEFQKTLWTYSLAKKGVLIYWLMFAAEYTSTDQIKGDIDTLLGWDKDLKDVVRVLASWIWKQWRRDTNLKIYNNILWPNSINNQTMDISDIRDNVLTKIAAGSDIYMYQIMKYSWTPLENNVVGNILGKSDDILRDLYTLANGSLSHSDIPAINDIINKQATNEMKQKVRFGCILNNPKELMWSLVSFDIQKVFWFDKVFFDQLYQNSPDREYKEKMRNDLTRLSELIQETGNNNIARDLFDTYNLTNYGRYSKNILKHMVGDKEHPTWKPIFPIFMTKRDFTWAFNEHLNDGWKIANVSDNYDIRVFEPGDDNQKFFWTAGILEKFHTQYIAAWWKRENVNSLLGMHGSEKSMLKSKSLNTSNVIQSTDRDVFIALSKYLKGWTVSFLSCSTWWNSEWENNIAQAAAKWLNCRVMAPNKDANLKDIVYDQSWWVEFINYVGDTSTVIYDGRQDIETKEDSIEIDKDTSDNVDILANDGLWAADFAVQTWIFWDVIISQTENENKRKLTKWNNVVILEKKQDNWKYKLSIDATWSENWTFEIPYTSFSKWLPKIVVDRQWNESVYENNFRVESDSNINMNIVKSKTGFEENKSNQDKIYTNWSNIMVDIQEYINVKSIDIYDMTWKLVENTHKIETNRIELDMSWKAHWTYIVRVLRGTGTYTSKKIILS